MSITIKQGDCRDVLKTMPDKSVHCCVTSPPYFGLRDYGHAGQIGLEATPDAFVAEMVAVFRDVRRVLRDDGTLWLNLGDSYVNNPASSVNRNGMSGSLNNGKSEFACRTSTRGDQKRNKIPDGLKPKDLFGIPWRVAFALQSDGWYLRQDIIWSKPNPMPESVTDRCTKAHEYIFLMSKSARYFYDAAAIAENATAARQQRLTAPTEHPKAKLYGGENFVGGGISDTRNKRSVWEVATQPLSEAHFATFPPALIEPCIEAGTSERGCCSKCGTPWMRKVERTAMVLDRSERTHERGRTRSSGTMLEPPKAITTGWSPSCSCDADAVPCTVLDPFGGAGTTGLVADRLGRNAFLIELNPEYAALAERRIRGDAGMFAEVSP